MRTIRDGMLLGCSLLVLLAGAWGLKQGLLKNSQVNKQIPVQMVVTEKATASDNTITPEDEEDWNLILVNRWNPIPENYEVALTQLQNGHAVDSRIYPELQQMFDDARAQGIMPTITSSYRTTQEQQQIMDEKISDYQAEGYSYSEAKELAEKWVAIPGTSEHQIGIAVDISTADAGRQDASIVWQWLNENSYQYGFILRYPEDKTDITGTIYEPWHYRYVGKEAAKEIYEQGVCLEEYLA